MAPAWAAFRSLPLAASRWPRERLDKGVELTAAGLRRTVPAEPPAVRSGSNLVQVRVSETNYYLALVPPVTPLGESIWLAISKSQYQRATGEEFSIDHLSAQLRLVDPPAAEQVARLQVGPGPQGGDASELNTGAGDVVWIKLETPAGLYGPVVFSLGGTKGAACRGAR